MVRSLLKRLFYTAFEKAVEQSLWTQEFHSCGATKNKTLPMSLSARIQT